MNRAAPFAVSLSSLLILALAGCSKAPSAPEPVRAVKTMVIAPASAGAAYEYAGEIRARVESRLGFRVGGLNRPFGFVALLGVIALMGMIMRNSVILIDQIEQDRSRGVAAGTAIVEAAVRRARPIMLTAAAAVLAMIPLSRSIFWGPMAVAIMGGLIVATALTLFSLPAMYAAWFRVRSEPVN